MNKKTVYGLVTVVLCCLIVSFVVGVKRQFFPEGKTSTQKEKLVQEEQEIKKTAVKPTDDGKQIEEKNSSLMEVDTSDKSTFVDNQMTIAYPKTEQKSDAATIELIRKNEKLLREFLISKLAGNGLQEKKKIVLSQKVIVQSVKDKGTYVSMVLVIDGAKLPTNFFKETETFAFADEKYSPGRTNDLQEAKKDREQKVEQKTETSSSKTEEKNQEESIKRQESSNKNLTNKNGSASQEKKK